MNTNKHSFWIANKHYHKSKPDTLVRLYIYYKQGGQTKTYETPIRIPFKAWDNKKKEIKPKYADELGLKDLAIEVNKMKSRILDASSKVNSGKISVAKAVEDILDKNPDGQIEIWLQETTRYSRATKKSYMDYLKAIHKIFVANGMEDYVPLSFSHLQDLGDVEKIAHVINSNTGNGGIMYLSFLDSVTDKARLSLRRPFKANMLMKPKVEKEIQIATVQDIYDGMNRMKTRKDYLVLNYWMLSFCLRGLDGQDICNLSKELISREAKCPYTPDYALEECCWGGLNRKGYLKLKRGKTAKKNAEFKILFNLPPIWVLVQVVKELVRLEYPQYAYEGEDPWRIFNFTTKDENWNEVEDGARIWKKISRVWLEKYNHLIGVGLKKTRHTYTDIGRNKLRLSNDDTAAQLGHRPKGAIKNYTQEDQTNIDLIHIAHLEEFKVNRIVLDLLYCGLYRKNPFIDFMVSKGLEGLMKRDKIASFGWEEEIELQNLHRQHERNRPQQYDPETESWVEVEGKKSSRLKTLEKKKSEAYRETMGDIFLYNAEEEATQMDFRIVDYKDYLEEVEVIKEAHLLEQREAQLRYERKTQLKETPTAFKEVE